MNEPLNPSGMMPLSDDEMRLVRFYRCLSFGDREEVLITAGERAMAQWLPDQSATSFMPIAGGVEPERIDGNIHDLIERDNTIAGILYYGIQATGEPTETLLGPGDDPDAETEAAQRFAAAAQARADEQGTCFRYNEAFACEYLRAWRWELLLACETASRR